jgi:hypothetical protein
MILMGDEVRRTQRGNNNAYCQDNETSWFDWTLLAKHADIHRFVKLLNARRLLRDVEHERRRVSLSELIRKADKAWHGVRLHQPDWRECSHSLALTAEIRRQAARLRVATGGRQGLVAPMDRHVTRFPGRHRPLGQRAIGRRSCVSDRGAFGSHARRNTDLKSASPRIHTDAAGRDSS